MKIVLKALFIFLMFSAESASQPIPRAGDDIGASGLALPRFVSISRDKANMRTGPGEQYPIDWVYTKRLYPLEIFAEYEQWRQVRDIDGTEGWIHVTLLSGKRTALVTGGLQMLYDDPVPGAEINARVEAGTVAEILECTPEWCRLEFDGTKGWLEIRYVWGIYEGEEIN